ncbi:hypothetical protein [Kineosporia succinea]|uniref:Uncharacterized protein n=1 Tax=Kineosporia succinea TaxID=84632 RepID=A0ABT9NVM0_9ACTN|nr:hypothetical protein [Kineosporia succinea]MDP9824327.1 hypothetical protein [Kineosporia succinea]
MANARRGTSTSARPRTTRAALSGSRSGVRPEARPGATSRAASGPASGAAPGTRLLGLPAAGICFLLGSSALGALGVGLLVSMVFVAMSSMNQPADEAGSRF